MPLLFYKPTCPTRFGSLLPRSLPHQATKNECAASLVKLSIWACDPRLLLRVESAWNCRPCSTKVMACAGAIFSAWCCCSLCPLPGAHRSTQSPLIIKVFHHITHLPSHHGSRAYSCITRTPRQNRRDGIPARRRRRAAATPWCRRRRRPLRRRRTSRRRHEAPAARGGVGLAAVDGEGPLGVAGRAPPRPVRACGVRDDYLGSREVGKGLPNDA